LINKAFFSRKLTYLKILDKHSKSKTIQTSQPSSQPHPICHRCRQTRASNCRPIFCSNWSKML